MLMGLLVSNICCQLPGRGESLRAQTKSAACWEETEEEEEGEKNQVSERENVDMLGLLVRKKSPIHS